jgi:hypothetical protein
VRGSLVQIKVALGLALAALPACAQQPIAYVPVDGVTLSGSLDVSNGRAAITNSGAITAGERAVHVSLVRGGDVRLCATTTAHFSVDRTVADAASTALLIALDRGAMEVRYTTGKYSDVLMTPDMRILISGPGEADLRLRVNSKGDTCVDNRGDNAPYVIVSSQFEGGAYRVQPNQRVLFEHGSLREVNDNEQESCGCPPPPTSVASTGVTGSQPAKVGQVVGGPSSTPSDTTFPLAQSEGLAPAPPPPTKPIVPAGEAHAQVSVPLTYDGADPPPLPARDPDKPPVKAATSAAPAKEPIAPTVAPAPRHRATAIEDQPTAVAEAPPPRPIGSHNIFKRIGRLFKHLFG